MNSTTLYWSTLIKMIIHGLLYMILGFVGLIGIVLLVCAILYMIGFILNKKNKNEQ